MIRLHGPRRARLALCALLALEGCDATGRRYVEVPLQAQGAERAPFEVDGWTVELARADVGFGPFWLCATEAASPEFCDAAVLELRQTVTVDGLDPLPDAVATLNGITGTVRSGMWDYGVSWLPTASRARVNEGAPEGHSLVLRGVASRGSERFAFEADVDLAPPMAGALVVRGQRVAAHDVTEGPDALTVRIDPRLWVQRMDFDRLAARGQDPVVLRAGDPDHEALVVAMTAGALPALEWARP